MIDARITELVLSHQSENSVLQSPRAMDLQPFTVGDRERLATCTGISWYRGYHLAVGNLHRGHLRVYRFDEPSATNGAVPQVELLHELSKGVAYPEDVSVTPDGRVLAITHSMSDDFDVSTGNDTISIARVMPSSLQFPPASSHSPAE